MPLCFPGHVEVARAALAAGVRVVQLRDKERDAGELLPLIWEIRRLCRAAGALFLVNDRVDLAQAADGVHLGQTDFPVALARAMLGPERCVGISVENEEQVRAAEEAGADYLGVGAIYGTSTKLDAGDPVGLEQLRRFRAITALPLVAIGGITRERLPEVRRAGADSAAVIGAIAAQPEPETAARELVRTWEAAR
ncbi:MAG: thiamine phosphate synthase [Armatimonadetes bacterium]|nr:thiamine phosphate synthase [Armatimonadota bacterium]